MKIWSGRFSAGFGAACSCFGLMIGGGGSTAKRAAAEVIGTGCGAEATIGTIDTGRASDFGGSGLAGIVGFGMAGAIVVVVRSPESPKKSPTRVSTNWLIEMLLVSQKALSFS
ncbi:MAG TPA: hypothetical protein VGL61_01350 [Kofleriaceae bacterium]